MKQLILIFLLACMQSVYASEPADVPEPMTPEMDEAVHNSHLDRGIECESCHIEIGRPELKPDACADCHDDK